MRTPTLSALALVLGLAAPLFATDNDSEVAARPDPRTTENEAVPGDFSETPQTPPQTIGNLLWHTDYSFAYKEARAEKKMLFIFFRDNDKPRMADVYENEVLTHADLEKPLSEVVRVVLPLDAPRPFRVPEVPGLKLITHVSFKYMYGRQGIAMIDLTNRESEHYGQVVSAHPFTPGRHYTVRGTKIVLGLPKGTVTQRALIYAVRLHPAAPISTTDGKCHGYLCQQANHHSKLMSQYESVGHHDWGTRYSLIASNTGRSAMEVAAMGGSTTLIEAAIAVVDQWYGSPAHWGIMSTPAEIFGYDLVRAPSGNWYGTGIFAH